MSECARDTRELANGDYRTVRSTVVRMPSLPPECLLVAAHASSLPPPGAPERPTRHLPDRTRARPKRFPASRPAPTTLAPLQLAPLSRLCSRRLAFALGARLGSTRLDSPLLYVYVDVTRRTNGSALGSPRLWQPLRYVYVFVYLMRANNVRESEKFRLFSSSPRSINSITLPFSLSFSLLRMNKIIDLLSSV